MIDKVKSLEIPNDEELFSIVKNVEGMVDVNDIEKYVDATDEYGDYPRTIPFHKLNIIDYNSLFS